MRSSLAVFVAAAALAVVASADAKGPDYALISGPGISRSIRIDGDGEAGTGTPLGALATYGGFATQAFGHHPDDPAAARRPAGSLGARYAVVYSVPTPTGRRSIVVDLYPFATPRPLTYMRPGQPFFPGMKTHGGWYVAPAALKRTLVAAGLPADGNSSHVRRWAVAAVLAAVALAAVALSRRRLRPSPVPAP